MASDDGRPLRADAQRNREQVLRTAAEIFTHEGLSVPVHEIARRAGVGTGTVSRHFPTKVELFTAVLLRRMQDLCDHAEALAAREDPGTAFFGVLRRLVLEGVANRGLGEALAGEGVDVDAAAVAAGCDITGRLRHLLDRAQRAGAVREDVTFADVKALMKACLQREESDADRLLDVVGRGLRP